MDSLNIIGSDKEYLTTGLKKRGERGVVKIRSGLYL